MLAQKMCNLYNDGFGRTAFQKRYGTCFCHRVADDADEYCRAHGDNDPCCRNPSGKREFFFILDCHKAQKDMRHSKIAEAPCQCGANRQETVGGRSIVCRAVRCSHAQIACKLPRIFHYGIYAARNVDAEADDNNQRDTHNDALNQVRCACRKKSACCSIRYDNNRADKHCGQITDVKNTAEQLAARRKP